MLKLNAGQLERNLTKLANRDGFGRAPCPAQNQWLSRDKNPRKTFANLAGFSRTTRGARHYLSTSSPGKLRCGIEAHFQRVVRAASSKQVSALHAAQLFGQSAAFSRYGLFAAIRC